MKLFIVLAALIVTINGLSDLSAWSEFKVNHSKNYELVEENYRFKVFQQSLRQIEEHNAKYERGETSYTLKLTNFADWTDEEFATMLNAQAASKPEKEGYELFEAPSDFQAPASIDWRQKGGVSGVKDQGNCGSCWSFSVTGALESQLMLKKEVHTTLSEQQLVDCSRSYGNAGCNGGNQIPTFRYVQQHGIVSESEYPYTAKDGSCKALKTKVISSLSSLYQIHSNEASLIAALASVGPVTVSVDATTWKLYGSGIFDNANCGNSLNHAVLGVGYGTNFVTIKNSWGKSWGEQGYIRLARGKDLCGVNQDNSYALL